MPRPTPSECIGGLGHARAVVLVPGPRRAVVDHLVRVRVRARIRVRVRARFRVRVRVRVNG